MTESSRNRYSAPCANFATQTTANTLLGTHRMLLARFSLYCFKCAHLDTLTTPIARCPDECFGSRTNQINDALGRTFGSTYSTIYTLLMIDYCKVIYDLDTLDRTILGTYSTSYAPYWTYVLYLLALVM